MKIKTPSNELEIEIYKGEIDVDKVKVKKKLFDKMCKEGCKNYNNKYSCPPYSPSFEKLKKGHKKLYVLMYKMNLDQLNYNEYLNLKLANSVMKSRIDKYMRENFSSFLSTGSCRLCKPCRLKLKEACRYPKKRMYSLEATGVDVDFLTRTLFNIPMKWYKNKKAPEYTCVVCGAFDGPCGN